MTRRKAQPKRARDVVRAQLAQERRRKATLWTTVVAVCAVVLAGAIGYGIYITQRDSAAKSDYALPRGATTTNGGLPISNGTVTVDLYLDLMCPACKELETLAKAALRGYIAGGKVQVVLHPLNILDDKSQGTRYSTRAAAALGCAADERKAFEYTDALYARQPAENTPGLTNDQLVALGETAEIPATSEFAECVRSQQYADWVGHVTGQATERGISATPTVYVNGEKIDNSVAALTAAVQSAT